MMCLYSIELQMKHLDAVLNYLELCSSQQEDFFLLEFNNYVLVTCQLDYFHLRLYLLLYY